MKLTQEQAEQKMDENCGMTTREVSLLMARTMQKTIGMVCQVARHQAKLLKEQHQTTGTVETPYAALEVLCTIIEKDLK